MSDPDFNTDSHPARLREEYRRLALREEVLKETIAAAEAELNAGRNRKFQIASEILIAGEIE